MQALILFQFTLELLVLDGEIVDDFSEAFAVTAAVLEVFAGSCAMSEPDCRVTLAEGLLSHLLLLELWLLLIVGVQRIG